MNYQINKQDIEHTKFKFQFHEKDLNYDMFKKGKESKLIVFYGEEPNVYYEVPIFWMIKNGLTLFKGKIHNKKELELIINLIDI